MFGPGGARDPANGTRYSARRNGPGMELVVAAHKSVGLLGLVGRGGRHARHFGHRTERDIGVPGRLDERPWRATGALPDPCPDQRFGLGAHPPRHLPGGRP